MIISGLVTSSQRSGLSRPNRPAATGPFQIVEASRIRDRASLRDCRNRRTGDWAANVCGERRDDAGVGLVSLDSMGRSDRALVNFKSIHASRKPATRVTPLSGGLNARKRIPHHMGGPPDGSSGHRRPTGEDSGVPPPTSYARPCFCAPRLFRLLLRLLCPRNPQLRHSKPTSTCATELPFVVVVPPSRDFPRFGRSRLCHWALPDVRF
jgi:hypothetical protein